jgi:hypothetical protein
MSVAEKTCRCGETFVPRNREEDCPACKELGGMPAPEPAQRDERLDLSNLLGRPRRREPARSFCEHCGLELRPEDGRRRVGEGFAHSSDSACKRAQTRALVAAEQPRTPEPPVPAPPRRAPPAAPAPPARPEPPTPAPSTTPQIEEAPVPDTEPRGTKGRFPARACEICDHDYWPRSPGQRRCDDCRQVAPPKPAASRPARGPTVPESAPTPPLAGARQEPDPQLRKRYVDALLAAAAQPGTAEHVYQRLDALVGLGTTAEAS